jgi:atypical dual specificity phosphatase
MDCRLTCSICNCIAENLVSSTCISCRLKNYPTNTIDDDDIFQCTRCNKQTDGISSVICYGCHFNDLNDYHINRSKKPNENRELQNTPRFKEIICRFNDNPESEINLVDNSPERILSNYKSNINEILPGLYLTDAKYAQKYDYMLSIGIKQILTVGVELRKHTDERFQTMHISIDDDPTEQINGYFEDAHKFIEQAPTLVHCAVGMSRSATIVASYVMKVKKLSALQAIEFCKARRPIVRPNRGFIVQLIDYDKYLLENEYDQLLSDRANERLTYDDKYVPPAVI